MARRILIIATLSVVIASLLVHRVDSPEASAQTASPVVCTPVPPPPCKDAFPGVIQIIPDSSSPANKARLARKRFYVSSCPFSLNASVDLTTAPTLEGYYHGAGASPQLIAWLEANHCETIYCRELTVSEVTCESGNSAECVPEFNAAYRHALSDLKGDASLALKMITTFTPLSEPKLRTGFYEARAEWLKTSVAKIEAAVANDYQIRSTMTDKDGIGFFYDLCPGSYYVSSVAPIDIDGVEMVWETVRPIKVEGPPEMKTATRVTLAFPPNKDKKNYFSAKPLSEFTKPAGQ